MTSFFTFWYEIFNLLFSSAWHPGLDVEVVFNTLDQLEEISNLEYNKEFVKAIELEQKLLETVEKGYSSNSINKVTYDYVMKIIKIFHS